MLEGGVRAAPQSPAMATVCSAQGIGLKLWQHDAGTGA
jgi:hypothetical protein